MKEKPQLLILVNNHFDPMWRRCWQRPLEFKGETFISYHDIETYYLLDNLKIARQHPEYKFSIESVLVLRTILRDHPEVRPVLEELVREGRFEVSGAGETIVDANMIHGESLVRNFVDGFTWLEEEFGIHSKVMLRNDAFGNSAQLPQIARGLEIDSVAGLFYSWPENTYWRGLDGSRVLHRHLPVVAVGGDVIKYPPCEACHGTGKLAGEPCSACSGRGIPPDLLAKLPGKIDTKELSQNNAGLVLMGPEELLPNPAILDWAREKSTEYDVQFALVSDLLPFAQPALARMEGADDSEIHPGVELNPNNAGVWVSRIKTKQIVRRQEQAMLALESLAVMAVLKGNPYPHEALKAVRQKLYFTMFHDAITATHVDAAYDELLEIMAEIDAGMSKVEQRILTEMANDDGKVSVINPSGMAFTGTASVQVPWAGGTLIEDAGEHGTAVISCKNIGEGNSKVEFMVKDLPPFTARILRFLPSSTPRVEIVEAPQDASIENDRFRVDADAHGLTTVFDKQLGRDILICDEYRPAELILEHDEGSPWATLSPDFTRTPLSQYTKLVKVEKQDTVQQLTFSIQPPFMAGYSGMPLKGELTVRLVKGLSRIGFQLNTSWSTFNHRLRVAMPVPKVAKKARYLYEIPYGVLEREPYEPTFNWYGANGDWPVLHWGGIEQEGMSVVMFNRGTPSYLMEQGKTNSEVMFLSLLRSPAITTYLHEPYFYIMTDYDGMRDEGTHSFDFAVSAYAQPLAESPAVLEGESYQRQLPVTVGSVELPEMPQVHSKHVRLSAVKWAEKADAMIVRLVEYRGKAGTVEFELPDGFTSAAQVNLMERQDKSLPIENGNIHLPVRAWEIISLKLFIEQ